MRYNYGMTKRTALLIAGGVILVAALSVGIWYVTLGRDKPKKSATVPVSSEESPQAPQTIRLIATGDFIAHDAVNANAKQADGSYNYMPMMQSFQAIFKKADIRFCNDPILNGGTQFGVSGYPTFNSPTEFVTDMGKLGCNLVNTASNHTFDRTQAEINASVAAWESVPNMLAVAGQNRNTTERDRVHIFPVNGVKVAFLAYTTYMNASANKRNDYGVNMYSRQVAQQQIAAAKAQGAEIIIVSMRWGTEYSQSVNAEQQAEAQFLADQGVSLVLGHGPHVVQPVETLKGTSGNETLVWYSLGNFLNTQEEAEALFNGLAVVDFDVATRRIARVAYAPIYMHYEWTAAQKAQGNLLARNNLKLYPLEEVTQDMIDRQQLKTTVEAQTERLRAVLTQRMPITSIKTSEL